MKKATIDVERYNFWDNKYETYEETVTLTADDMEKLVSFTPDALEKYLHDNCVGKCTTIPGDETYFIPRINISTLSFSIQVNYYVWIDRESRLDGNLPYSEYHEFHKKLISEQEFNDVVHGLLDVKIENDGSRIFLGQMRLKEVSSFMSNLAIELHEELQD